MLNRQPPRSSALLGLPKAPKALVLQHIGVGKLNMVANKEIVTDFWFCPNDIERCMKGTKCSWTIDWPQVPDVWLVLSGTNLRRQETLLLQDAGFKLQERPSMSSWHMFMLSNLYEAPVFDHLGPPNPTFILQLRTASPFGGMQTPRWLSIAISRRALATSKERSLVSLFFLSLVLEP
jgi:hypothetical protein